MTRTINDGHWHQVTQEVMTGISDWRVQHPTATFREIETELDTRLARLRARMLEDLALQSAATSWRDESRSQHPTCPTCDTPLQDRGTHARSVQTHGGQHLTLKRSYGVCPACGTGLFPPR
jgi:hypothetical protein